jgi:hypothetical protein
VPGTQITNTGFDVYETPANWGSLVGYDVSLNYNKATTTGRVPVHTTFDISFDRTIQLVPNSFKKYEEDGKLIHQVQYDESIWIVNPNGTRTAHPTSSATTGLFSPRRIWTHTDYQMNPILCAIINGIRGEGQAVDSIQDAEGHETGAALFKERVTVGGLAKTSEPGKSQVASSPA